MKTKLAVILNVVGMLALIGAVSAAVFFYRQYRSAIAAKANAAEISSVIASVGKLIELPTNETPTLATVTDIGKLQGQAFFKHAKNGDQVLIFQKNLRAILYRPSANKIIEVGPIKLDGQSQVAGASTKAPADVPTAKPTAQTLDTFTMALYNGSVIGGITATVEAQLVREYPQARVIAKAPASRLNYANSLVIDLKGTHQTQARSIASYLGATVAALPAGEATPAADILVIIGNKR